jgi:glycosyltransferase involved in cell wall biosynthesis
LIDQWVIVDTGSTDGTQGLIRDFFHDIPGELHERPWVNFAHNRNEALDLAQKKADYIFFIDADEVLRLNRPIDKNALDKPFYVMPSMNGDTEHLRIQMVDNDPNWKWVGVLHESIVNTKEMGGEILRDAIIDCSAKDGFRFCDPQKFHKDARILEKALQDDPSNSRYVFYLAQSYLNAGQYFLALQNYMKRAGMSGESCETFFSQFCVGYLQDFLKMGDRLVIESYLKAIRMNAERAEPYERLGRYFYQKGWPLLGYLLAQRACFLPKRSSYSSYVLHSAYDFAVLLLKADCAKLIGKREEADRDYRCLLADGRLPSNIRQKIVKLLNHGSKKLVIDNDKRFSGA